MTPSSSTAGRRRPAMIPLAAAAADAQAGAAAAASSGSGKRAVIVGAGPAGALAAMLLAQQGWRVDVFERAEPLVGANGGVTASIGPRSYNILLSERAAVALDAAGVDFSGCDVPDLSLALRHKLSGGPAEGRSTAMSGRIRVANRGVLAGALVAQCRARHPDAVSFHFGQELSAIDTANHIAFFRPSEAPAEGGPGSGPGASAGAAAPSSGEPASYRYDLLVGADGAGSVTRQLLQRYDPDLQVAQERDVMEFKTMQLGPAGQFIPAGASAVGTFQTWSDPKLQATVIGSSTRDGTLRCVFILPAGEHAKLEAGGAAAYEAFMRATFPSLPEDAIQRGAPQLVDCPTSNGGTLTTCSQLVACKRAVLIGDAAHSVYPSLGQGANAALEGAAALAAALRDVGSDDVEAAAEEYSRRWLPNAHAVVSLTKEAFGGNARAFAPNLKLAALIAQTLLSKLLPFVPKPAFFSINSTAQSYASILARSRSEMAAFKAALAAAVVAAAAAAWRAWGRAALAALGLA